MYPRRISDEVRSVVSAQLRSSRRDYPEIDRARSSHQIRNDVKASFVLAGRINNAELCFLSGLLTRTRSVLTRIGRVCRYDSTAAPSPGGLFEPIAFGLVSAHV
jgi:hypothetical protein